jgi:EmrB/QacA subfamily drug resistance transporter
VWTGSEVAPGPDRARVRVVFAGLVVTMLLASLDHTIVSTALPTIVGELGGVAQMSWVVTAYILAATIVMPVYGRLGDLLGRKGLFLGAIVIFLVGSVIGGFAGSIGWLVAGRFVQGLGGGGLIITAQAIVADVVPARQRGRYLGVLGAVFAVSSIAGPLLGGYFTDVAGWRWCFWINLPIGAVALLVAALVLRLPPGTTRRPRLDVAGMALSAVAVTGVVLVSTWGGTAYSWTSPTILGLAGASLAAGTLFVLVERRAAQPIIPRTLFADRSFTVATGAGLLVSVGMFAGIAYLPTFLQMVGGHSATAAGLLMVSLMAGVLVASTGSGQIISATGRYKGFPVAGMAVCTLAFLLLSTLDTTTSDVLVVGYLALLGVGIGLVLQVLVLVVQNAADHRLVGTATAAHNFFREIGASLGTAVVGAVFGSRLAERLAADLPAGTGIDAATVTPAAVAQLPDALRDLVARAYAEALSPVFGYLAPLFAVGVVVVAFLPHRPLRTTVGADPAPPTPFPATRSPR